MSSLPRFFISLSMGSMWGLIVHFNTYQIEAAVAGIVFNIWIWALILLNKEGQ